MSEEQNTFKITDRRLFNADGTPRQIEETREETGTIPDILQSTSSNVESRQVQASSPVEVNQEVASDSHRREEEVTEDEDMNNPASFINFLMTIASNAAAALGIMEHPVTGLRSVDLAAAKHWIDILAMLQQKTKGNLSARESQALEGLLGDMRMQFVSLTTAPPTKSKWSGRDITGGR
jgi:hypothetical protein